MPLTLQIGSNQSLQAEVLINPILINISLMLLLLGRGWSPSSRKSDLYGGSRSDPGLSDDIDAGEVDDGSSNDGSNASGPFTKPNLRSRPANVLPPPSNIQSSVAVF